MRRRSQGPGRATRDGQTSTRTAVRGSNYSPKPYVDFLIPTPIKATYLEIESFQM